jgi:hypothetical protein
VGDGARHGRCSKVLVGAHRGATHEDTVMQHPGLKLSLATLAALSTLSGCVVEARPAVPTRTVYVEPTRTVVEESGRTVVGEPIRPPRLRED